MSQEQYPEFVRQRFEQLNQRIKMPIEQIQREYDEVFEKSELSASQQFPSASADELLALRRRYAIGKVWTDLITRPPQENMQIIYTGGHDGLRHTRGSMKPYSNIYVIVTDEHKNPILTRMVARGSISEIYQSLNPNTRYDANLGRFGKGGDLIVDSRTEFMAPTAIDLPVKRFNELLKIPVVTVADAPKYPSKKVGNSSWADATDWRCIIGFVSGDPRTWTDKTDKKTIRGVCNIVDETVNEQPSVDQQGNIISPGLPAWTAPEHLIVDDGSYCAFYGTLTTDKGKSSMNCFLIRPIFGMSIDEDE